MLLAEFINTDNRCFHAVRPSDLDRLGHVNNARALEFLELGRLEWAEERFFIAHDAIAPVLSRYEVNYEREIFLGRVEVRTRLEECRMFSILFSQEIWKPGEERRRAVVATAEVCFIHLGTRRPVRVRQYSDSCLKRYSRIPQRLEEATTS